MSQIVPLTTGRPGFIANKIPFSFLKKYGSLREYKQFCSKYKDQIKCDFKGDNEVLEKKLSYATYLQNRGYYEKAKQDYNSKSEEDKKRLEVSAIKELKEIPKKVSFPKEERELYTESLKGVVSNVCLANMSKPELKNLIISLDKTLPKERRINPSSKTLSEFSKTQLCGLASSLIKRVNDDIANADEVFWKLRSKSGYEQLQTDQVPISKLSPIDKKLIKSEKSKKKRQEALREIGKKTYEKVFKEKEPVMEEEEEEEEQ